MSPSRSVGQFNATLLPIVQGAAAEALAAFRARVGVPEGHEYPRISCGNGDRSYTEMRVECVSVIQMVHLYREVQGAVNAAITNAALQQNRSTMTKPIPETLGEIELELATIENRMRKRMETNRSLDVRTRQLRTAADKLRYPSQPQVETIRFRKRFTPGGTTYTYAAQRTPQNLWYVTGSGHPTNGRSWRQLIDFIREDNELVNREPLFVELGSVLQPF